MDAAPSSTPHPQPVVGEPMQPSARYEIVDVVRGFALFGVFVANMIWTSRWFALTTEQRAVLKRLVEEELS